MPLAGLKPVIPVYER